MATPVVWREATKRETPESVSIPIPVVGEASSPAELVDLLKRAHLQRLAAAEHGVDVDDRYVTTEEAAHDRA